MYLLVLAASILSTANAQISRFSPPVAFNPSPIPLQGQRLVLDATEGLHVGVSMLVDTWEDQSGLGNHMVQIGGAEKPLFQSFGLAGTGALHFDGNDTLAHPNALPAGSYSIVLLCSLSALDSANHLLGSELGWSLSFEGSPNVRLKHAEGLAVSAIDVAPHTPTVVSVTFDAATGKLNLYQDSELAASEILPVHGTSLLVMGGTLEGGTLQGQIAQLLVYDRVLAPQERLQAEQYFESSLDPTGAALAALSNVPDNGQIFQQSPDGLATFEVSGTALSLDVLSIEVDLFADGVKQSTLTPVSYTHLTLPTIYSV